MEDRSRSLRVLHVTCMYPHADNPGMGSFVKSQIESLQARNVDSDVLFIAGNKSKLNYLWATFRVFWRCMRRRYDLVHAHYGLAGLVARVQFFVPVVVSYCGDDLYGHADDAGKPTASSLFLVTLHQWLSRFVPGVIVKSRAMGALLPIPDAAVIPNGVDFDLFRPMDQAACRRQLGLAEDRRYILFPYDPGRVRKNFAGVREAVKLLNDEFEQPIEILVVHDKPNRELPLYMNAADVLVLASYWEGSPNAVKEAMACNLPAVATAVGDVPELFDGVEGYQLCTPELRDIAAKIGNVLRNPQRTRGREAIAQLRIATIADRVLTVYADIANPQAKT